MKHTISTKRHNASHGHNPRGRGGWMFEDEAGNYACTCLGTYTEARTAALQWMRANSVNVLYVCP